MKDELFFLFPNFKLFLSDILYTSLPAQTELFNVCMYRAVFTATVSICDMSLLCPGALFLNHLPRKNTQTSEYPVKDDL